jgi:hypothetical protein
VFAPFALLFRYGVANLESPYSPRPGLCIHAFIKTRVARTCRCDILYQVAVNLQTLNFFMFIIASFRTLLAAFSL